MPPRYRPEKTRSRPTWWAGALVALGGLGACGGSGSGPAAAPPAAGPSHPALQPATSFSDDDLRHFLTRTQFGVTHADLAAVRARGVPTYVDSMLQLPTAGMRPFEARAELLLRNSSDPPGLEGGFPSQVQLTEWWLRLMEESPTPFQEVMALFWHGHFSVSSDVLTPGSTHWMREHVDLLRRECAGNLRRLLIDVARDHAMMMWLDTVTNTRRAPNENFAREFWELFTLGVDNGYTQQDVLQAARAFTGYRSVQGPRGQAIVQFVPNLHDPGTKVLLGAIIPGQSSGDDFEAVVDITLTRAPCAEFICTELFEHFCYPSPEPAIVAELADLLRQSRWELRPVLAVILESKAFFSPQARKSQVKSPVEHVIGFVRSTGLRMQLGEMALAMYLMGQVPTAPPTVEGWPGGSFWLGAQGVVERANFLAAACTARSYQASLGFAWSAVLPPPGQRSAGEVVDALAALLDVQPTAAERDAYIEYLDTERLASGAVISSPWVASSAQVDERARGLLYVLGQHPTYMMR